MQTLPPVHVPHPHVRVDQKVMNGSPYVARSRLPVRRIFTLFRDGVNVEALFRRFSLLGPAKVLDALSFALDNPELIAADVAREQEVLARAGRRSP